MSSIVNTVITNIIFTPTITTTINNITNTTSVPLYVVVLSLFKL